MEMKDRIKKIRRELDLTQSEFAAQIGATQNTLTGYETGRRNPSASVINNICKTFNVNEEWLRTGEGEMFNKMDATDMAFSHFGAIMGNASAQKKAVLSALVEMVYCIPDDKWDYIFNQFQNCLSEAHKDSEED